MAAAADDIEPGAGLVVVTLAWVGIRWGELVALRRERVDVLRRRLDISEAATEVSGRLVWGMPKTDEPRSVTMPGFLAERIGAHLGSVEPGGLVFTGPRGGPLRYTWRARRWLPALEAAELEPMRVHDLRHTAASLMISTGAPIKAVQRQLGHKSAAMTLDKYGHLYDDDLDALGVALDARYQAAAPASLSMAARAGYRP